MATNDVLRAIAEAATPGPWACGDFAPDDAYVFTKQDGGFGSCISENAGRDDAHYIATFDPRRGLAACDLADAVRLWRAHRAVYVAALAAVLPTIDPADPDADRSGPVWDAIRGYRRLRDADEERLVAASEAWEAL